MEVTTQQPYRITVEPILGRVTARRGEHVLAASDGARMMHETRLNPTIYFPRSDVFFLADTLSDRRTFCPFKGTAVYRNLVLPGETLTDAAWAYPRALPESKEVEDYIAFMPGVVDAYEASAGLPPRTDDGHIASPIADWLFREAWLFDDPATLTHEVAKRFVAEGIAVSRLNVSIWSLHPQIAGTSYIWQRDTDSVEAYEAKHENLTSEEYLNSPIRHVSDGLGGVRQPLTTNRAEFSFPIMDTLRAEGATDYVAMPLPFSDGRINVMTMATDHPDGFTTANLGLVFECSVVISRFYEVHSQREKAQTLLGTFLGKKTGARVLGGEIKRGDGDEIEAAILFCDLRNSSRLEEDLSRQEYIDVLNRFFETVGERVDAHNGEILKFVGDGVLAVFPALRGPAPACLSAMQAAQSIADTVGALTVNGSGTGLRCSLGASFGTVTYGNVGSADRLDFTVIGAAANVAARLSDLGKSLEVPMLFSHDIATKVGRPLQSLGEHRLHNIVSPVEVFTL